MNAAREGPECGTEIKSGCDARRQFRACPDLRDMAMTERAVAVQIAVPMRMMRAVNRFRAPNRCCP